MRYIIGGAFITLMLIAALWYQLRQDYIPLPCVTTLDPQHIVFAVDLHQVVLKPSVFWMCLTFLRSFTVADFMFILKHPAIWYNLWHYRHRIFEYNILALAAEYPQLNPLLKLVRSVTNCQTIKPAMVSLLTSLKVQGYKIYLLSNIEEITRAELFEKLPVLKNIFDGWYTPSARNHWHHKPNADFYDEFKKTFAPEISKRAIILIDNSKQNIQGAEEAGMCGILFTSAQALQQLLAHWQGS